MSVTRDIYTYHVYAIHAIKVEGCAGGQKKTGERGGTRNLAAKCNQLIGGQLFGRETLAREANRNALEIMYRLCEVSVFPALFAGTVPGATRHRRSLTQIVFPEL